MDGSVADAARGTGATPARDPSAASPAAAASAGMSEFARMDIKSRNFTPGKYKGAEEAAIRQQAARPLPAGVRANHSCDAGGCAAAAGGPPQQARAPLPTATPPQRPRSLGEAGLEAGRATLQQRGRGEVACDTQRFLAQNTIRSLEQSVARERAGAYTVGLDQPHLHHTHVSDARLPPGRRGVQALLDYNKCWAAEVTEFNPRYFKELAKEQKPEYLWIGCSDSRVPANEIVGLHPGDVFVHRNIGNLFSLSDLNCLSALQFAIDCLKVQHVIIAGHYKCGGVTAAMNDTPLGLTDHWIMQVTEIKNKFWERITLEIPSAEYLNVLCELNVLQQLSHATNCRIIQRLWRRQNDDEKHYGDRASHIHVRPRYASDHNIRLKAHSYTQHGIHASPGSEDEVECHGWVYSLDDGMLRPLLSLNRLSDLKKEFEDATEAVFVRYASV